LKGSGKESKGSMGISYLEMKCSLRSVSKRIEMNQKIRKNLRPLAMEENINENSILKNIEVIEKSIR